MRYAAASAGAHLFLLAHLAGLTLATNASAPPLGYGFEVRQLAHVELLFEGTREERRGRQVLIAVVLRRLVQPIGRQIERTDTRCVFGCNNWSIKGESVNGNMKSMALGVCMSAVVLSGCTAIMTGMEFVAEIGECMAGVDCVEDTEGFDGIQSDDGTSAMIAGTRAMPTSDDVNREIRRTERAAERAERREAAKASAIASSSASAESDDSGGGSDSTNARVSAFSGEMNICVNAGPNCFGLDFPRFDGGALTVSFRNRGFDEQSFQYTVEFTNQSDCDITIGSTMIRHGETLNAQTLDFGNIGLGARQSRESPTRTFSPSPAESAKHNSVVFTYSGIASCA